MSHCLHMLSFGNLEEAAGLFCRVCTDSVTFFVQQTGRTFTCHLVDADLFRKMKGKQFVEGPGGMADLDWLR